MKEKELLELLKQEAESVTPPDSLKPDAIEAMLKAGAQSTSASEVAPKKNTSKKFYRYLARYGSIAAVFVLGITVLWQSNQISSLKENQASVPQQEDQVMILPQTEEETDGPETSQDTKVSAAGGAETAQTAEASTEQAAAENAAEPTEANDPEQTIAGSSVVSAGAKADQETETDGTDADESTGLTPSASSYEDIYDAFRYAETYQQVYDTLHSLFGSIKSYDSGAAADYAVPTDGASISGSQMARGGEVGVAEMEDVIVENAVSDSAASADYSVTNLQELGVDEGDIVKTDGTYIYILKENLSFAIVKADGTSLTLMSTTPLDTSGLSYSAIREMYLDGNTLSIIAEGRQTFLENDEDIYYSSTKDMTVLYTWDITDRSHPVLTGTLNQEGFYSDSRKVGNYMYLFTGYYPYIADTYEESTIVPRINGESIPADDFYLPELPSRQNYLIIASVDLTHPERVLDQKVLVSAADHFYVSAENIYIAEESYRRNETTTGITKFHYENGQITGVAAGSVKGYLNNSFSMNEYKGCLRVVSTYYDENYEEWNSLYVLDESLRQLSVIDDLGKGETIRSARFLGDTGYFVTFRQTDPLFSVDLSDPTNPKILGELKVSGFSSYLHFYGENLLLGIGYEADETTGITSGLKLSMFDISDPANVTEVSRTILPGITWCPAIENYKEILVDPEKNVIGFYCDNRYLVYSYHIDEGFTRELIYDFYTDDLSGAANHYTMRGLYIGNILYLAGNTFVVPFDMENGWTKQELLTF